MGKTTTRAHGRRIMEFNCTIFLLGLLEGPLYKLLLVRERTQPRYIVSSFTLTHRVWSWWWSPSKPPHWLRRITVCLLRLPRRLTFHIGKPFLRTCMLNT